MIYGFGEYRLDTQRYELYRAGELCKVEPMAFDLLVYLIRNCDRTVTRDELFERVWDGEVISDAVLSHHVMVARKAVGDDGRSQRLIKTLHGRGYRFIEPVRENPPHDNEVMGETQIPAPVPLEVPILMDDDPGGTDGIQPELVTDQNVLDGSYVFSTVLCAILDNIPGLTEQLGLNALQRVRHRFFSLAQDVVQQHGGTLKFYGADGVLVVFSTGDERSDHAIRGVSAALELLRGLGEAQLGAEARLGLHTGSVDIENVTGETPNLAVWLQYQTAPNSLLMSGATMQLMRDQVGEATPVVVRIPGHAESMTAYQIHTSNG